MAAAPQPGSPAYAQAYTAQFGASANPLAVYKTGSDGTAYNQGGDIIPANLVQGQGVLGASTTTSSAAPAAATPVDTSEYDQSIANTQDAINRLPTTLNSGNSAIDASYTDAINQLLGAKNSATQTYNANKLQTGQDFVTAKNTIGSNAGTELSGIERLLGSKGAGGSSAATIAAPDAVARQATLQRNDATGTYGDNEQTLDQNFGNYITGYNNSVASAGSQRDQQKQQEEQSVDTNRATLLQSLATLFGQKASATGGNATAAAQPYLDQANSVLDNLSNFTTAPISYNTTPYAAPALSTYTTTPNSAPTTANVTAGSDYVSPFLATLLGKQKLQTATA